MVKSDRQNSGQNEQTPAGEPAAVPVNPETIPALTVAQIADLNPATANFVAENSHLLNSDQLRALAATMKRQTAERIKSLRKVSTEKRKIEASSGAVEYVERTGVDFVAELEKVLGKHVSQATLRVYRNPDGTVGIKHRIVSRRYKDGETPFAPPASVDPETSDQSTAAPDESDSVNENAAD